MSLAHTFESALLACAIGACSGTPQAVGKTLRPGFRAPACSIERGQARCALGGATLRAITVPFAVRAWAARRSGGVWLLGTNGELARVARDGSVRGRWLTSLSAIAATRDFVCGAAPDGQVRCARDFREDTTCRDAETLPGPFHDLPLSAVALRGDADGALLCAGEGSTNCVEITPTCDRGCLAVPACGPVRCAAPCAATDPSPGLTVKPASAARVAFSSEA